MTTLREELEAQYLREDQDEQAHAKALRSWGAFVEDPAMERTIARRAANPEAYGPPDLAEAIYTDQKRAAAAAKETE